MKLNNNFAYYPTQTYNFNIEPRKNKTDEIENFEIMRYQKQRMPDFSILGPPPIISKMAFLGRQQLYKGFEIHADSTLKRNVLTDILNYIQLFGRANVYTYFNLDDYIVSKLKNFGSVTRVYSEWFTLDTI